MGGDAVAGVAIKVAMAALKEVFLLLLKLAEQLSCCLMTG